MENTTLAVHVLREEGLIALGMEIRSLKRVNRNAYPRQHAFLEILIYKQLVYRREKSILKEMALTRNEIFV